MSITDGHEALIKHLRGMSTTAAIVLPNGPSAGAPRYVVQAAGGGSNTMGSSTVTDSRPEIAVRVETDASRYSQAVIDSNAMVKAIVAHFPVGASFDGVTIEQAPSVRPPLPVNGGVYAVPVIIRGRLFF